MPSMPSVSMPKMSSDELLNRISMILLIVGGLFFLYEGSVLVNMHAEDPQKISPKVAVAGSLTIFLGFISLCFAVLHIFIGKKNPFKSNSNSSKMNTSNMTAKIT